MDAMENDNLNLRNKLPDSIPDDENEELRCLGTMKTDGNFIGLHEEYSAAARFHHSQFPDVPVSFSHPNFAGRSPSFSDPISYTDIDWSFDGSRLGPSSQNWSHSILTNAKNKTNASFHVRSPEVPRICRVPMRGHAAEGLNIVGCDGETNNHNLQSSGCGEKIDLNITAICSGFQPHCFENLDAETLGVGCQTKAPTALNKADKISGFRDNTGDLPNLSTFSENSIGVRCSNIMNFSLHPSSVFQTPIIVGEEHPFPTPSNEDHLNAAVGQNNEDNLNLLNIAAPSTTASSNSQIGVSGSSQSWSIDLASCLLRRDQSQQPSEQQSHTDVRNCSSECSTFAPSLGISGTICLPDLSFELDQSVENVVNALTTGNQDARELGTVEHSGLAKSYPKRVTSSTSSPSLPNPLQFASTMVSANTDMSFQPQTTQVDLDLQNQEQTTQPFISESVLSAPSKFEDVRARPLRRSRTSRCYIKCRDMDQTPKLSEQRCFLCKRDLSLKPEGSVFLPKILPTVAVLPCGHVFHDLCLERITPQDQAEDPPCIPCAVGES